MNNETHEDRVKILADVPKDGKATDISTDFNLIYLSTLMKGEVREFWNGDKWVKTNSRFTSRSLSDIQQLVDKQNEIDKWHKAYLTAMNEFDKKCKALNKRVAQVDELQNEIDSAILILKELHDTVIDNQGEFVSAQSEFIEEISELLERNKV